MRSRPFAFTLLLTVFSGEVLCGLPASATPVVPDKTALPAIPTVPTAGAKNTEAIPIVETDADTDADPEATATAYLGKSITSIDISGNAKTRTSFLRHLLTVETGRLLAQGDITRSVQNMKNTKLFKSIKVVFESAGEQGVVIRIAVEELWTTIPVLLFSTGGGSVLILAGIVEANLFGHGAASYLTYQYLDGTNTWMGQIKHPDFLDSGLEVTPYFWLEEKNNEIRTYDTKRDLLGGYTSHQDTFGLTVRRPLDLDIKYVPLLFPGIGLRYSKWSFSEQELSPEAKDVNTLSDRVPPDRTQRLYASAEIQFGRVDFDGYLANGTSVIYRYTQGEPLGGESKRFREHFITARHFRGFPPNGLLAVRYEWTERHSNNAGDEDMLGGLFHVRGLPNDVFRGLTLWQLNTEFRYIVARQRYADWQGVLFTDAGDTGRTRTQQKSAYRPSGAAHSVGGGVHLLFPDISELTVRIDYGWLLSPFRASGLSLGLVQFVR